MLPLSGLACPPLVGCSGWLDAILANAALQRETDCCTDRDSDEDPDEKIVEQEAKTEPGAYSRPNAHRNTAVTSLGLVAHPLSPILIAVRLPD